MRSGKAPTADLLERSARHRRRWSHRESARWSRRHPASVGVVALLTIIFWGVWAYLVLPLVTVLLWIFGVRLFVDEMFESGARELVAALIAYSSILLALAAILVAWIFWNIARYSGSGERRIHKLPEVDDLEVGRSYLLDVSLLETLRDRQVIRLAVDGGGSAMLLESREDAGPARGAPETRAADGSSARSGHEGRIPRE